MNKKKVIDKTKESMLENKHIVRVECKSFNDINKNSLILLSNSNFIVQNYCY